MTDVPWIDANTRIPNAEDADKKGCVLAWHRYNGMMVTGWHQFEHNANGFLTHWAPGAKPPDGFPEWEEKEREK